MNPAYLYAIFLHGLGDDDYIVALFNSPPTVEAAKAALHAKAEADPSFDEDGDIDIDAIVGLPPFPESPGYAIQRIDFLPRIGTRTIEAQLIEVFPA